ncbi:MAG TPA: DUF72 domain-containing protein [Terriglobales bacterium]|nr:DUF72 domain-containing protein [Terriglobales bacterium]
MASSSQESASRAGLYVGTSGWAYASWKPDFFPPEVKQKDFLRYYATRLNTTEVNYTFRRMLAESTAEKWLAETPDNFKFIFKAHQAITHFKRLKDAQEPLERFVNSLNPIERAGRLGPALFQLPPNLKCDLPLLQQFLGSVPKRLRCAFEFRHQSWFADEVYRVLSEHNAALCVAENEDLVTPDVVTASFSYYRYRKPEYSSSDLHQIAGRLGSHAHTREVYVFFKHEDLPQGPVWASEVLKLAEENAR